MSKSELAKMSKNFKNFKNSIFAKIAKSEKVENVNFALFLGHFRPSSDQALVSPSPNPPQILVKTKAEALSGPNHPQNPPQKGSKMTHFWVFF